MGHYKEAAKGSIRWLMELAEAERERCRKLRSKPGTPLHEKHRKRLAAAERAVEEVRALRERMIVDNLGLVRYRAWKFHLSPRVDREDLISEGVQGLIHAVEEFDPNRGVKFGTYATTAIWSWMVKYLQNGQNLVRVPYDRPKNRCAELKAKAEKAWQVPFSLSHRDHNGELYLDVPTKEHTVDDYDRYDALYAALDTLPPHHRRVLELYYLHDMTLKEAGKKLGYSRQNCQQILQRSLLAMRKQMGVCA